MDVAIPNARIDGIEDGKYVVHIVDQGVVHVPDHVVSDDSEVWKVGDSGVLLVKRWWASENKIRWKKIEKHEEESDGAPVELFLKPANLISRWRRMPVDSGGKKKSKAAKRRERKALKKRKAGREKQKKFLERIRKNTREDAKKREVKESSFEKPSGYVGLTIHGLLKDDG